MVSRRTLGLDSDIMEKLKELARERGMTISGYLRKLLSSALELESMGIYAPAALEEARFLAMLRKLGFVLVPRELLEARDPEKARELGRRVGLAFSKFDIDPQLLVEYLARTSTESVSRSDRVIVVKQGSQSLVAEFLRGIAEVAKLRTEDLGYFLIIELGAQRPSTENLRQRATGE